MAMALPTPAASSATIAEWLGRLQGDLYGRTLPFWLRHSVDSQFGGYFNCLDEDGAVWDTKKHVWLQGRQVWMLSKLCNDMSAAQLAEKTTAWPVTLPAHGSGDAAAPPSLAAKTTPMALTRDGLMEAARGGVEFLRKHAIRGDGQVYFSLARDGTPAVLQRKIFSATFLIMALNEFGRASGNAAMRAEAITLLERVLLWIREPELLRESFPGAPALTPLNVSMILLNVINELAEGAAAA